MGLANTAVTMLCHPKNRGGARTAEQIKYLVYHYTGNDGDCAVANAKYYRDTVVQSSAHYFVDDTNVYRSVPDLEIAWAVGGRKWADCPQTGGGRLYGVVTNANSISIEMCDTMRDGKLMASERTLANAAALGRELMEKYNIPPERVVRHFDVTGKHCPAYFMNNGKWLKFKKRLTVQEGDAEMTLEQFKSFLAEYRNELKDNDAAGYSDQARQWAVQNGVVQGNGNDNYMWEDFLTREQMVVLLYRFAQMTGKA